MKEIFSKIIRESPPQTQEQIAEIPDQEPQQIDTSIGGEAITPIQGQEVDITSQIAPISVTETPMQGPQQLEIPVETTPIPTEILVPTQPEITPPSTAETNIPIESGVGLGIESVLNCTEAYLSEEYENYIVETEDGFIEAIQGLNYACAFPLSPVNIALSVRVGRFNELLKQYQGNVYLEKNQPFTLSIISPSEAANINVFHISEAIKLTGKDTIIGFLDTGIDYLNEEFMTLDKRTRILEIWDQTIEGGTPPRGFKFGSVYTENEINQAIEARRNGGDPYSIVPQRDTIGHGTAAAGVAAATGVNIPMGAAPECNIIMVKLKYAKAVNLLKMGIVEPRIPVYETIDLILAVRYLVEAHTRYRKPMVIFIPLNTNFSGADGSSPLEKVIDIYSVRRGIVFVAGSGNQGDSGTHTSGIFRRTGEVKNVEITIDDVEGIVPIGIYGKSPDRFSIGIVSPSGETIERFPVKLKGEEVYPFVFEGSTIRVEYSLPDEKTGDEVVVIYIANSREGIWQIRLYGEYIVNGRYDVWLPQKELLNGDTRFINPDAYTTVAAPGTALNIITTAFYNQGNVSVTPDSGRGYTRDGRVQPIIATGGVDVATTFLNNETISVTGSSAASAVLAGACAMILEWGIVKGNDLGLYGPTIAAYLITGADRRQGDIYPNTEWGYGTLDLLRTFENLRSSDVMRGDKELKEKLSKNLFVNIPSDTYYRLQVAQRQTLCWGCRP
ncbi:S8 family peptidase [Clostridium sp.]|uniref:S8 family peptidase n=1 Tax=Clostridium sp. TaxID=1506 RepID=UPI002FC5FB4E